MVWHMALNIPKTSAYIAIPRFMQEPLLGCPLPSVPLRPHVLGAIYDQYTITKFNSTIP